MVNPIDFGGHSSNVKVTMGIIHKCGVRGDAMLYVVLFFKRPLTSYYRYVKLYFMYASYLCIN